MRKFPILLIGDIHGDFPFVFDQLSREDVRGGTVIQVGDFGLGFSGDEVASTMLSVLNRECLMNDVRLIILRGNHDNPDSFKKFKFSNITLIHDMEFLTIPVSSDRWLNFAFVGGAVSVDRVYRIHHGMGHWDDEGVVKHTLAEITRMRSSAGIDTVDILVTHSAPTFAKPLGGKSNDNFLHTKFAKPQRDETLVSDCRKERKYLDSVVRILEPTHLFYGHFHEPHKGNPSMSNGRRLATRCLAVNETYLLDPTKL